MEDFTLADITKTIGMPRKCVYDSVCCPDESSDEDQPLATLKTKDPIDVCGTSYQTFQPKDIHPMNIKEGVHVLVKVRSERKITLTLE